MLSFKRPRRPAGLKERSKQMLEALGDPTVDDWPKFTDSFWQSLKNHFMKAQYQKCGYCEIHLSEDGDVEHFRPKSEIQELLAEGTEVANTRRLRGRKKPATTERGYWWLAYEWNNYLLSCSLCNQKYKSALFPVSTPRRPGNNPNFKYDNPRKSDINTEKPLLLNPFDKDFDPYEFFEYTQTGFIKPRNGNIRGLETIRVCGLHRISLTHIRALKAVTTSTNAKALMHAVPDSPLQEILAVNMLFDGHEVSPFAGMVRVIFQQESLLSWDELEALVKSKGWMPKVEDRVKLALTALQANLQ